MVAQPADTAQAYRRNRFVLVRGAARLNKLNKRVPCAVINTFIPSDPHARSLCGLGGLRSLIAGFLSTSPGRVAAGIMVLSVVG